jgi:hypothetical protein
MKNKRKLSIVSAPKLKVKKALKQTANHGETNFAVKTAWLLTIAIMFVTFFAVFYFAAQYNG